MNTINFKILERANLLCWEQQYQCDVFVIMPDHLVFVAVVAVVYFILSRLLYLAFKANLGLLCKPILGMGTPS